jgi:hypothetical protein
MSQTLKDHLKNSNKNGELNPLKFALEKSLQYCAADGCEKAETNPLKFALQQKGKPRGDKLQGYDDPLDAETTQLGSDTSDC